jgi:hypothetical protein
MSRRKPTLEEIINRGTPGVDVDAALDDRSKPYRMRPDEREAMRLQGVHPRPRRGGNRMSPAGQGVRRRHREAMRQPSQRELVTTAQSLWSKLIPGQAAAGQGIVPYASMPQQIRKEVPLHGPVVGWDPKKLTPKERGLLFRLRAMGQPQQPAFEDTRGRELM